MVFVVPMVMVSGTVVIVVVVVAVAVAVAVAAVAAVMVMTGGGLVAVAVGAAVTFAPVRGRRHCGRCDARSPVVILRANQLEQLAGGFGYNLFRIAMHLKWAPRRCGTT